MTAPVTSRSRLLSLLGEACELEHGLLCLYLYAAFSLKQDLSEGGMTWQQLQKVRLWAAQLYAVAAEEMLHLAQAWNLLSAIGGTPRIERPPFPQPATYYEMRLPLALGAFGEATLQRFVMYELPGHIPPRQMAAELGLVGEIAGKTMTVGELYGLILGGFEHLPEAELFMAGPAQVDERLADFPTLVKVKDRATARRAIEMIVHQGEGATHSDPDCHFGMFLQVLKEYREEVAAAGADFAPVRDLVPTPVRRMGGATDATDDRLATTLLTHPFTLAVDTWFSEVYALMLGMLQFVFQQGEATDPAVRRFAKTAIVVMPTVLKPLGEALALLPAHPSGHPDTRRAGPSFDLRGWMPLPSATEPAQAIVQERLEELVAEGARLAEDPLAPAPLVHAVDNLRRYGMAAQGAPA